jgi:uncharacterized membrane protein YfcA
MKIISQYIKPLLALILVGGFILYLFITAYVPPQNTNEQLQTALIGFVGLAIGYYLGSSTGQQRANDALRRLSSKNEP